MYGITQPEILPPAWSLGLEVFFYLLIPFLIIFKCRGIAFALSACIFIAASFGAFDSDVYGYRLLPGVLFIFLCGSYLYRGTTIERSIVAITVLMSAALFLLMIFGAITRRPYTAEVSAGIAMGIPAVYFLSKLGYHKIDEFFGNISYGVFLNHFVMMYVAEALGYTTFDAVTVTVVLIAAFACSGVSYYLVERPALRLRHTIRSRARLAAGAEPIPAAR